MYQCGVCWLCVFPETKVKINGTDRDTFEKNSLKIKHQYKNLIFKIILRITPYHRSLAVEVAFFW